MNTLKRNKQILYHCKRYPENGVAKFSIPVSKNLNYQPTNSVEDITSIGETYYMYLRIKCNASEAKDFKAGDRCYIYVSKPETHDVLCKTADYVVDEMPLITLNVGEVKLKRLSSD